MLLRLMPDEDEAQDGLFIDRRCGSGLGEALTGKGIVPRGDRTAAMEGLQT